MIGIQIDVNANKLQTTFAALSGAVRNMAPVMQESAGLLLRAAKQNFDAESARRPHANHVAPSSFWADLKESTKRQRAAQGTWPGKKLQRSRRLLDSLENAHTATSATVGTKVLYAKYLQHGTRKMDPRPFLTLQTEDAQKIREGVERHLRSVLGR